MCHRNGGADIKDGRISRAAIYGRVSTDGQTVNNQLSELRMVAERNGWQIVQEFVDQGIIGAKGREQRPAFDTLWKRATRREFDVVMVWAVDRFGGSLQHLINFLSEPHGTRSPCPVTLLFVSAVAGPIRLGPFVTVDRWGPASETSHTLRVVWRWLSSRRDRTSQSL